MKSMGHVAYDAFRKECPWLLAWGDIAESLRQEWCELAQGTARATEEPNGKADGT